MGTVRPPRRNRSGPSRSRHARPSHRATAPDSRRRGSGSLAVSTLVVLVATLPIIISNVIRTGGEFAPVRYGGFAGSALFAAGAAVAVTRRHRRSGAGPTAQGAGATLRLAADFGAARFIDRALRILAAELTAASRTLPSAYAASLTDSALALHIAPPEFEGPPAPWRVGDAPHSWIIDRVADTSDGLPAGTGSGVPGSTRAPYPGLVTIGTDDHGAHILVDLAGAPGIISLGGDVRTAYEVALSMALELATNPWSDDLRVFVVGFSEELTPVAADRLLPMATLGDALRELEALDHQGRACGDGDRDGTVDPALRGRQAVRGQALPVTDLLILSAPPSDDDATFLTSLSGSRTPGIGVIAVGDTPAARWRFTAHPDRRLSLDVLDLDVNAQTLAVHEYATIIEMLHATEAGHQGRSTGAGAASRSVVVSTSPEGRTGPTLAPVPWVPYIPPSMRPPASGSALPPSRPERRPAPAPLPPPPRPTVEPPNRSPDRLSPAVGPTAASARQSQPDPHSGSAAGGTRSPASRTLPTRGDAAFPPPRELSIRPKPTRVANPPARQAALPPAAHVPCGPPPIVAESAVSGPGVWRTAASPPGELALAAASEPTTRPAHGQAGGHRTNPPPKELPTGNASASRTLPTVPPDRPPPLPFAPVDRTPASGPLVSATPSASDSFRSADPPPRLAVDPQISRVPAGSGAPVALAEPICARKPIREVRDPEIRILGVISVNVVGPLESEREDELTELVAYLALHRTGAPADVIAAAVWPGGTSDSLFAEAIEHARTWLGPDDTGRSRIVERSDGRWQLADDACCDWDIFVACMQRSSHPGADIEGDLTTALRLVTGPPLGGLPAGRYLWLVGSPIEDSIKTAVVDVAHRLATLTLGCGDTATAVAACRTGLRAVPTAEVLWRDLLRTVAARGERRALESVIHEMQRAIPPIRSGRRTPGETDELVRDLLAGLRHRRG